MKKRNKDIVVASCAATAMIGAGLMAGAGVYADGGGLNSIYVYDSSSSQACYFYMSSNLGDACDGSYGSYDSTNKILTLGSGVNDKSVTISGSDTLTIKATDDISAKLSVPDEATITYDFGDHSWTETSEGANVQNYIGVPSNGKVIFKSGTFDLMQGLDSSVVEIDGATVNLYSPLSSDGITRISNTGVIVTEDFNMLSGTLNVIRGSLMVSDAVNIEGGNMKITLGGAHDGCVSLHPTGDSAEFNMTGGNVELNVNISDFGGGITGQDTTVTISGGTLSIYNAAASGIDLKYGSSINFNGGTTTISEVTGSYAVVLYDVDDPEHAISFGDGIGIIEPDINVFWYDNADGDVWYDKNITGFKASDSTYPQVATITEGGTVRKTYGFEFEERDFEYEERDSKDDAIAVPDTGAFNGEDEKSILTVVSLGLVTLLSGVVYIISYIVKRCQGNVKFRK